MLIKIKLFSNFFDGLRRLASFYIWLFLFFITIILRVSLPPQYIEHFYSRGFYVAFRGAWDLFFAWLPFPLFYVFWAVVVVFLAKILRIFFLLLIQYFLFKENIFYQNSKNIFKRIILFLSVLGTLFFWFWGFNYGRVPFEHQIDLKIRQLDTVEVTKDFQNALTQTTKLREILNQRLGIDSLTPLSNTMLTADLEQATRQAVQKSLQDWGLPHDFTKPRLRELRPQGILSRFGASGVYWLWVAECNMDAGLHPLEKPFTAAHELTHGYGWTDEAVCNFVAFVACARPENDPQIQYSAWLTYFRYLVGNLRRAAPFTYEQLKPLIGKAIRIDLEAIRQNQMLYKDFFDTARFYDAYLKTQGVKDGVVSYSRLLLLVNAHFKKEKR